MDSSVCVALSAILASRFDRKPAAASVECRIRALCGPTRFATTESSVSVEFPTAARGCVRARRRARAAVENSCAIDLHPDSSLWRRISNGQNMFAKHFIPD